MRKMGVVSQDVAGDVVAMDLGGGRLDRSLAASIVFYILQ